MNIAAADQSTPIGAVPHSEKENARQAVTVVVPCFNEKVGLHYLAEKLDTLTTELGDEVALSFVLVDDGSTDATWDEMQHLFEADPRFTCIRHKMNRGISAASLTGIRMATDEAVAVIDSDCTYDPSLIAKMLPQLGEDVSIVTASPYHPMGGVEGVPLWRLFLSQGASWAYRRLLRNKLATYTSCFRVYRRSAVLSVTPRHEGFTGVAEKLALLDRQGWRIVEVPALLETRRFGESKLRIAHVIRGHVGLMSQIAMARLTNQWTPTHALSVTSAFEQEK
jgi:glycosyltransferase involved in cell wall biosynthesis